MNPEKAAVLVIDMQNTYGSLGLEEGKLDPEMWTSVCNNINAVTAAARSKAIPVIHFLNIPGHVSNLVPYGTGACDTGMDLSVREVNMQVLPGDARYGMPIGKSIAAKEAIKRMYSAMPQTYSIATMQMLHSLVSRSTIHRDSDDFLCVKPSPNAFQSTQLDSFLAERSIEDLVVTGLRGHECVLYTSYYACHHHGKNPIIISDATDDLPATFMHSDAKQYPLAGLGIDMKTTPEIVELLQ